MPTSHLDLDLIDPDDMVSVDPLNNNFTKIDAANADSIIERGASGDWWYRKYRNGRYECGIEFKWLDKKKIEMYKDPIGWSQEYSLPAYPITFVGRPYCNIVYLDENGGSYAKLHAWVAMNKQISRTNPPTFRIITLAGRNPIKPAVGCHVIGHWK